MTRLPHRAAFLLMVGALAPLPAWAQPGAPVDLLHAVPTDVAVSSVYRSRASQVPYLFDGDLTTAWNSRTGDLVGAWIDVRVPTTARVTSIALTVGFTKQTARSDLFTGNQRIARVRVSRDGNEVGTYALDPSSRALQTIPISGPGGTYRIEVVELLAGSRSDWREVCVSELRVMGTAPDASVGARFPRHAVGALPDPASPAAPADRAAVTRTFRQRVAWLGDSWGTLDNPRFSRGDPDPAEDEVVAFRNGRLQLLRRVLELVETAVPSAADPLRAAIARPPAPQRGDDNYWLWDQGGRDLEVIDAALAAVAVWIGDDDARCRWARTHAGLRLGRIEPFVVYSLSLNEFSMGSDEDMMTPAERREGRQEGRALERLRDVVGDAAPLYRQNPRQAALRLARVSEMPPRMPALAREWSRMSEQLERARTTCGW